ncbi:MAG: O-antigen ligase family protein [Drouetiella hepatica Uher 2000/2452]|uniref:O-antigen ligase family protein n=1 Tax=Drouetiella hepatica Uher 2000/2452 TaxID=904376 RepID=A0A951QCI0_9CYAN|nr:O-antigen ligase family protein [Drouetiella hepatica Uher 2000/2452]
MLQQSRLGSTIAAVSLESPGHNKFAWLIIWAWILVLAIILLAGAGRVLVPVFPVGSVTVGLFLYFRAPALYIGYTWWFCFLGSLIRRIIDYQSGQITPGRWGLTSMLVASISLITLFQQIPKVRRDRGLPFILSAMSVIYGFLIGLAYGRLNLQYMVSFFEWLGPIAFGFHLFSNWRSYPLYRQVTERCFVWGVLFMGAYGIFQFCVAPNWDRFYLDNLTATSFGKPFPFEIRVFSSLSSPQAFATVMMGGLLLLFSSSDALRLPASSIGYLSFLLSMARSGWLGWIAGTITFFPFLKPRFQMRFVLTLVLMVMLVTPLVTMEPFAEGINQRLESLSNPEGDVSLQGRSEGYSDALNLALSEPIGQGLGSAGPETALGGADSGILPLFFSLGWLGVVPYLTGTSLILLQVLRSKDSGQDTFASASRSIVLGTLAQVWFNNVFFDVFALILWGFLGISLAAQRYHQHQTL